MRSDDPFKKITAMIEAQIMKFLYSTGQILWTGAQCDCTGKRVQHNHLSENIKILFFEILERLCSLAVAKCVLLVL